MGGWLVDRGFPSNAHSSGHSLRAVTLLHGVQNGLVVLDHGLSMVSASWLLFAAYFILAIVLMLFN